MIPFPRCPLLFEPVFQNRLWGGALLDDWLPVPPAFPAPIGEAWILSDRADHSTAVAQGPLQGLTLAEVLEQYPVPLTGSDRSGPFPLLLKYLDAQKMLSVQVHPSSGVNQKTEAWVVLSAGAESRIYAGLKPETDLAALKAALDSGTIVDVLTVYHPKPGDCFMIPGGMVHSMGGDLLVCEIQQNSDTTYRLYDWGHLDATTGRARELQIEEALACIDFSAQLSPQVTPIIQGNSISVLREKLFDCPFFQVRRLRGAVPFEMGSAGAMRILVCLDGVGELDSSGVSYMMRRGDVWILPALLGVCRFRPGSDVTILEIAA